MRILRITASIEKARADCGAGPHQRVQLIRRRTIPRHGEPDLFRSRPCFSGTYAPSLQLRPTNIVLERLQHPATPPRRPALRPHQIPPQGLLVCLRRALPLVDDRHLCRAVRLCHCPRPSREQVFSAELLERPLAQHLRPRPLQQQRQRDCQSGRTLLRGRQCENEYEQEDGAQRCEWS